MAEGLGNLDVLRSLGEEQLRVLTPARQPLLVDLAPRDRVCVEDADTHLFHLLVTCFWFLRSAWWRNKKAADPGFRVPRPGGCRLMRTHLARRTPGGGTREGIRDDGRTRGDAAVAGCEGHVNEGALLPSDGGHGHTRRHREGAQGGHSDASVRGHAEVGLPAGGLVDVHCVRLLGESCADFVRARCAGSCGPSKVPPRVGKRQTIYWPFLGKLSADVSERPFAASSERSSPPPEPVPSRQFLGDTPGESRDE